MLITPGKQRRRDVVTKYKGIIKVVIDCSAACFTDLYCYNCTVLYCTLLYCTVLYCTLLYCTVLYCTVLYCTVLYCTVMYCTLQYSTVLYGTLRYSTVLYGTLRYSTVLYCTAPSTMALYYRFMYYAVIFFLLSIPLCNYFFILFHFSGERGDWGYNGVSFYLTIFDPAPLLLGRGAHSIFHLIF